MVSQSNQLVEDRIAELMGAVGKRGIRFDGAEFHAQKTNLGRQLMSLEEDSRKLIGRPIKMSSRKDVAALLFGTFGLKPTPNLSVSKTALAHYDHPWIKVYQRWATVRRTLSLMEKLPNWVKDGRLTSVWETTNETSGRIYCKDANVQQLPKIGRFCLIPDEGREMILGDYSANELRVLAALSGSRTLMEFIESGDPHRKTAALMLKKREETLSDRQREFGKVFNYGPVYGLEPPSLASKLNISREEAAELLEVYFAQFPDIQAFIADTIAKARREGKVVNPFGHVRYLDDWTTDEAKTGRQAINTLCQGTAASLVKRAILRVDAADFDVLGTVHDSVLVQARPGRAAEFQGIMTTELNGVQFPVEIATGHSWGICMDRLHGGGNDDELGADEES